MNVENRNVSAKLIDNIEILKTAINEISVYDLNTYTAIELYYKLANKLNEVINELLRHEIVVSEQIIEQNECLQYLLGEGLKIEVCKKIDEMIANGTFEEIINHKIFNDLRKTVISNLRNTEGIINEILEVCQTYTDNFDKIRYGNTYTAWDKEVKQVNGKYELDCSSFINLLIHGVKFNNSRYACANGGNNGSPLFFHGIDSYKYRLANQIAKFCVEQGYAFEPVDDLSNIRAGDLIFFSWENFTLENGYTQEQIDFHNNAFMNIDHVAMYLDKKNDSIHQTIQYEKNTPQFLFDVNNHYMEQCILVARLPFANINDKDSKNLIVNGDKRKTCTDAIEVGTYYLNKKLEKGKMYSLSLNGSITTPNAYFVIQANGTTIHSDYGRITTNGTYLFYFLYQGEPTDRIKILVGSADTSITNRNGFVNWVTLNEGYKLKSSKYQDSGVFNAREIPLTDYIKERIVDGFAFTNNLVETNTHCNITLNLPVNEDFISNSIEIGDIGFTMKETQRIPCILVSHNNVSTTGVLQIGWDGKVKIIKYDSNATWRYATASGVIIKN